MPDDYVVIDTNVLYVASDQDSSHPQFCVDACVAALVDVKQSRICVLDDREEIMTEYTNFRKKNYGNVHFAAEAFVLHLFTNKTNPRFCMQVSLQSHPDNQRKYVEFPDDPELVDFDPSDKKFVAVALGSGKNPPISNAVDTDWENSKVALERVGVTVKQLC